ncbi:MAG: PEP-CTERM sorting domain-containing protein [Planctomycetota bacterium]|jgi:hypothetical protein
MFDFAENKEQKMSHMKLGSKLAAYSLAAGAAVGAATQADAAISHYVGPWFDSCPHFAVGYYDMILLKLDGTVLVDDAAIDPTMPNTPSIEFVHNGTFVWGDGKSRDAINAVSHGSAGIVSGYWSAVPEGSKLAYSATVDSSSTWWTSGAEVGLYGYGWFGNVGPWSGGGTGYLGMYIDSGADRHYGWAHISVGGARNEITLHSFAFEMTPNTGIHVGDIPEPMTLSLLAAGAAGLVARRKRA